MKGGGGQKLETMNSYEIGVCWVEYLVRVDASLHAFSLEPNLYTYEPVFTTMTLITFPS